ncbi:hypothetical protein Hanom_Chr00s065733g01786951 [Helianthus anomalus]
MGYAFEMDVRVIIYIMSDAEIDRVICSFIQEKVFLVCMVQSLIPKISTINWGRSLMEFPIHDSVIYWNNLTRLIYRNIG